MGYTLKAMLGTGTYVDGLACNPTGPASMNITVSPGAIYSLQSLDATAYGALAADTTNDHQIVKQGISFATQTFALPAPATTGQSVVYLIEAAYEDLDTNNETLSFFNASNPTVPLSANYNTTRQGLCLVQVKAGTAAATGSQNTPAPDAGFTGLYAITVANGQTTITSGNIATLTTAPFIGLRLPQIRSGFSSKAYFTSNGTWTVPTGVTQCLVKVTGGGAGSGAISATGAGAAGGGGGGAYSEKTITGLTPGTAITITVGAGGTGAGSGGSTAGNSGGTSSFGAYCSASGGSGGYGNGNGAGGTGGTATGGDLNLPGNAGAGAGSTGATDVGGQGGSAPFGGVGGLSSNFLAANGSFPGGGGGGPGSGSLTTGTSGAGGFVTVEW